MNICVWNVRGMNEPSKHDELSKHFWSNKVDVIGVVEARVKEVHGSRIFN